MLSKNNILVLLFSGPNSDKEFLYIYKCCNNAEYNKSNQLISNKNTTKYKEKLLCKHVPMY